MKNNVHLKRVWKSTRVLLFPFAPFVYYCIVVIPFISTYFVNLIMMCYFFLEELVLKANY